MKLLEDFIIRGGKNPQGKYLNVVSHGTVFTIGNSNTIEMLKEHKAPQGTISMVAIIFNFKESSELNPHIDGGDVGMRDFDGNIYHTFDFNLYNVKDDMNLDIENQNCANYPGGMMSISFRAFPLKRSGIKGIHYTIYEINT